MIYILALGNNTIMTGCAAVIVYIQMIKDRHCKSRKVVRHMALRAVPVGHHVIPVLAGTDRAVVAGCAVAGNTRVVKHRPSKGVRAMTVATIPVIRNCRDMGIELADTDYVIVAVVTDKRGIIDTQIMIKHTRGKGARGVTITAIQISWHMIY